MKFSYGASSKKGFVVFLLFIFVYFLLVHGYFHATAAAGAIEERQGVMGRNQLKQKRSMKCEIDKQTRLEDEM